MSDPKSPDERIWLLTGPIPTGPFDREQVHTQMAAGTISWETPACPLGGRDWVPLVRLSGFGPTASSPAQRAEAAADTLIPFRAPAQEPDRPPPNAMTGTTAVPAPRLPSPPKRPWSPVAIAWLGLPFSPMWAGVMAALNGRRLGSPVPAWIPITIGFGSLGADWIIGLFVDNDLVSLSLFLGALGVLWWVALRPQRALYDIRRAKDPGPTAGWVGPGLAGAPLALLVVFGFVVEPLRPLRPRVVCERFVKASTLDEAVKYTTLNLRPALVATFSQQHQDEPFSFELTDESAGPAELGGYLVGFRYLYPRGTPPARLAGIFHLVDYDGTWKIEDIYMTTYNDQALAQWIRLSTDYVWLMSPPNAAGGNPASVAPSAAAATLEPAPSPPPAPSTAGRPAAPRGLGVAEKGSMFQAHSRDDGRAYFLGIAAIVAALRAAASKPKPGDDSDASSPQPGT